jgi:hypothetical protein
MTPEEISAAISYNRERGYTVSRIETIQRVVGAEPVDGIWGPITVQAVFAWQGYHGLAADGKVGPVTLMAIAEHLDDRPAIGFGCWIDDTPQRVLTSAYFDTLQVLGLGVIGVMLNRVPEAGNDGWIARWQAEELAELHDLAAARSIEVVATVWPLPDAAIVDTLVEVLPSLLRAAGASALELDAESNWNEGLVSGFSSLSEAATTLAGHLRDITSPLGARLELTTYPYHAENSAAATLAPLVDRLLPQAYSVATRSGDPVPWSGSPLSPGALQEVTWHLAQTVPGASEGKIDVDLGLAAYNQCWDGHSAEEAMRIAFEHALHLGVRRIRWWSSKWLLGSQAERTPYGAAFLRSLVEPDTPVQ